jgi:hypothetical protein
MKTSMKSSKCKVQNAKRGIPCFAFLILNFALAAPAAAGMSDPTVNAQGNANFKLDQEVWQWSQEHLSVAAGPAIFQGNHGGAETAPSINVRLRSAPWSVEVGGNLPHTTDTNFERIQQSINGPTYTAFVTAIAEAHIAVHWEVPHGQQDVIVPDLGFGVSALQISDEIDIVNSQFLPFNQTLPQSKTAFSPLFEMGLHFFSEHLISASIDFAYVSYPNVPSYGTSFDLSLTGWMIRPMLQVKF